MSVDREQIRRDAEAVIPLPPGTNQGKLARHVLALLAELEQAEKTQPFNYDTADVDQLTGRAISSVAAISKQYFAANARLAKVPALVEAASNAKSWIENFPLNADHEADWFGLTQELENALAKWQAK